MEIKTLIEKKAEVLKLRRIARKYDVITKSDVVEIESEDDVLKRTIIGNTYNWLDIMATCIYRGALLSP